MPRRGSGSSKPRSRPASTPGAPVEAINAAQAERTAAQAEINNTPAPELMDAAEVYAGTNLQVVYEPETSIAEVSMRVNSVRVRGASFSLTTRVHLRSNGE
jgi:hypothetical protein